MVKYIWRAKYKNGKEQEQFNENGSENTFKDIDLDELQFFEVYTNNKNSRVQNFGLILENGQFYLNGTVLNLAPELHTFDRKFIYFRRRRETISQKGKLPGAESHVIGFECNIDNKVYNYMYMVDELGRGIVRVYK